MNHLLTTFSRFQILPNSWAVLVGFDSEHFTSHSFIVFTPLPNRLRLRMRTVEVLLSEHQWPGVILLLRHQEIHSCHFVCWIPFVQIPAEVISRFGIEASRNASATVNSLIISCTPIKTFEEAQDMSSA